MNTEKRWENRTNILNRAPFKAAFSMRRRDRNNQKLSVKGNWQTKMDGATHRFTALASPSVFVRQNHLYSEKKCVRKVIAMLGGLYYNGAE